MTVTRIDKVGLIAIVAATGLLVASNGFAASDYDYTGKTFEGATTNTGMVAQSHDPTRDRQGQQPASGDKRSPEAPGSDWFEVVPKGNYYYPVPPKDRNGDPLGDNLTPYFWNMSH